MIEQQLRELELREPPLGFDPDAVVDRIELSTRRRRAVIGTGLVVTAVLTAGLLVPTLRSSEHPQVVSGSGGPSSTKPVFPAYPYTGPARESEEWKKYLVEHLRAIAPQVTSVTPTTLPPRGTNPALWRDEVVPLMVEMAMTDGSVIAEIGGAPTVVHVEAFRRPPEGPPVSADRACPQILSLNPKIQCTLTKLPDSSSVIEVDIADIEIAGPFFRYAEHFRADGTVVTAASYVYGADNKDRVPLTTSQLRQLATNPAFVSD
jgi:hypothetical protein